MWFTSKYKAKQGQWPKVSFNSSYEVKIKIHRYYTWADLLFIFIFICQYAVKQFLKGFKWLWDLPSNTKLSKNTKELDWSYSSVSFNQMEGPQARHYMYFPQPILWDPSLDNLHILWGDDIPADRSPQYLIPPSPHEVISKYILFWDNTMHKMWRCISR